MPTEHTRAPWPSVFQAFLFLSILYVFFVWLMIDLTPTVKGWSLPERASWTLSYLIVYGSTALVFVFLAAQRGRFHEPLFSWNLPHTMVGMQIALIALINQIATVTIVTLILHQTHIRSDPANSLDIFNISTRLIIAPVIEETLFRGIILHAFLKQLKPTLAVVLSSLLFTFFHQEPARMLMVFPTALLLGWLYVHFRSIVPTIFLHAFVNATAIPLSFVRLKFSSLLPEVGSSAFIDLTVIAILAFIATVFWTLRLHKRLTFPNSAPA